MALRPQLWSLNGIATELSCNIRTVSAALATVPPDGEMSGRPVWLMTSALQALGCQLAIRNHPLSKPNGQGSKGSSAYLESRTSLASERAAILRLKRREMQGEVAPIEELADALRSTVTLFRSAALSWPTKCAPRMITLKTAGEAKAILDLHVRELLTDLASAKIRAHRPGRKVPPGWQDWVDDDQGPS